jgi:hypothetical protein
MSRLEAVLAGIAGDLERGGRKWALLGGLAVSARTEPRFTRDVDVAVAVADDADAESVVFQLSGLGYRVLATVEHDQAKRLATARLAPPGESDAGVIVDLLFASSGIEREIAHDAEPLAIVPGTIVPVARAGHLLALKLLSRNDRSRPQDQVDIRALVGVLDPGETARARAAVRLIEQRGYHRGRRLDDALDEALAQSSAAR